jgi:hypothetical protein
MKVVTQNLKIDGTYQKISVRHIKQGSEKLLARNGWRTLNGSGSWSTEYTNYPSGWVETNTAKKGLFVKFADKGTDNITRTMYGVNINNTVIDAVYIH